MPDGRPVAGLRRYRRLAAQAGALLPFPLAGLLVALAVFPALSVLVMVGVAALLGGTWWRARNRAEDPYTPAQAVALAALAVVAAVAGAVDVPAALAFAAALAMILLERPLRLRIREHGGARNLPSAAAGIRLSPGPLFVPGGIAFAWLWVCVALRLPGWLGLLGVTAACALGLAQLRAAVAESRSARGMKSIGAALAERDTRFVVYFSGPLAAHYQVKMWLPYLERAGVPFAIVTREAANLALAQETTSPVVWANTLRALDEVLCGTVRSVFYVNTERMNADAVRFLQLRHVSLNHGDSDKPPSYSPTLGMYDELFLAGQAAVDRFARHGVLIPDEKFVIVGRPQVEGIDAADEAGSVRTVLYAPTWRGGVSDMAFGSLRAGESIVRELHASGVRVMFRPHPYSHEDAESVRHIAAIDAVVEQAGGLTSAQTAGMSIVECFNASDALVTDISSVASDYLFSGKPLAVVDMMGLGAELATTYPLAGAAYVIDGGGDPAPALADMLGSDPLRSARAECRNYYLGAFPRQGYADVFVSAVRRVAAD